METIYQEEFIEETELETIQKEILDSKWTWGLRSYENGVFRSIPHWNQHFAGHVEADEEPYDCEKELDGFTKSIWNKLKKTHFKNDFLVRCYANGVTKGIDQRLHTDGMYDGAKTAIIYINKIWNVDWGGETILWNKSKRLITESYLPKAGSVLIFNANIWHGARPVSGYCDDLRITLMFKTRPIK